MAIYVNVSSNSAAETKYSDNDYEGCMQANDETFVVRIVDWVVYNMREWNYVFV